MGMDIKNVTLVTAIYDIGRDKWPNYTMSYNTYLWWMRNLLFLDTNLVIYTEKKFEEQILNHRKQVDPNLEKTKLIIQELNEIDGYKLYYEPLKNLMESDEFKNKIHFQVPEMTEPLYNVIMFSKMLYILDSYQKNYFDSDLYVWMDAGGIRNDNPKKNIKWPDLNKINNLDNTKTTFFSHHNVIRFENHEQHALSQMRFIQGTAFFVPKNNVEQLCNDFKDVVFDVISKSYIGSDEKIFDITYLKNPNLYSLIKSDWREYFELFL